MISLLNQDNVPNQKMGYTTKSSTHWTNSDHHLTIIGKDTMTLDVNDLENLVDTNTPTIVFSEDMARKLKEIKPRKVSELLTAVTYAEPYSQPMTSIPPPQAPPTSLTRFLMKNGLTFLKAFSVDAVGASYESLLCKENGTDNIVFLATPTERSDESFNQLLVAHAYAQAGTLETDSPHTIQLNDKSPLIFRGEGNRQDIYFLDDTVKPETTPDLSGTGRVFLRQLEGGGTANTYLTYNNNSNELEVMKINRPEYADRLGWTLGVEAKVLTHLKDEKNIVDMKDYLELNDGNVALFTEYCYMSTYDLMAEAVKEFKTGKKDAINECMFTILEGMSDALNAMHKHGYNYRDLKSENLRWKWDPEERKYISKLIDHGTVLDYEDSRRWSFSTGTPYSMEMEQVFPDLYPRLMMGKYHKDDAKTLENLVRIDCEKQMDVHSMGMAAIDVGLYALSLLAEPGEYEAIHTELNDMHERYTGHMTNQSFALVEYAELNDRMLNMLIQNNYVLGDRLNDNEPILDPKLGGFFKELTEVRTKRPLSEDIVLERRDGKPYFGVKHVAPTIDEEEIQIRLRPETWWNPNYDVACNMLEVIKTLERANDAGDVYVNITYRDGHAILNDRMNMERVKKCNREIEDVNYVEPELFEMRYAPYVAAAYANDPWKGFWMNATRPDVEPEAGVYTAGTLLNEVLAECSDIELPKESVEGWVNRELAYLGALPMIPNSQEYMDYAVDIEPVGYLLTKHEDEHRTVAREVAKRGVFDLRLTGVANDMMKLRVGGRIDYTQAKNVLEEIKKIYHDTTKTRSSIPPAVIGQN